VLVTTGRKDMKANQCSILVNNDAFAIVILDKRRQLGLPATYDGGLLTLGLCTDEYLKERIDRQVKIIENFTENARQAEKTIKDQEHTMGQLHSDNKAAVERIKELEKHLEEACKTVADLSIKLGKTTIPSLTPMYFQWQGQGRIYRRTGMELKSCKPFLVAHTGDLFQESECVGCPEPPCPKLPKGFYWTHDGLIAHGDPAWKPEYRIIRPLSSWMPFHSGTELHADFVAIRNWQLLTGKINQTIGNPPNNQAKGN